MSDVLGGELRALVSDSLEQERQLGRVYRVHMQTVSSPHLRRIWEDGWTLKRAHEEALTRLLVPGAGEHSADSTHTAPAALPIAREALSWAYDQERELALRYQDGVRLAEDPQTRRVLVRLEDEQRGRLDRIRSIYRDYSTS